MKFEDWFKNKREELGLSQIELGKRLGLSQRTISLYETGERVPNYNNLCRIIQYFKEIPPYDQQIKVEKLTELYQPALGKKIADILYEQRKSQLWLATQCSVTKSHISKIVSGKTTPSHKLLLKISEVLI